MEVTAHSGGHSYGGYSSCPGLVIDVSRLNAISAGGTAGASGQTPVTVGAGSKLIDVYAGLAAHGLLLPGGSCPTVGIAGLALGGGIGVFSRAYGLTCDQMASVEIVTADGVLHRCEPGQSEDLYWACRGGGGGNFGVVTSFGFSAHPIPEAITLFTLEWPWEAATDVLDAWLRWIPSAPDELWANCQMFSSGAVGGGLVKVTGVFVGSVSACSAALNPLTTAVGAGTTYRFVGPEDYLTATMIEAGCEGQPVAQCAAPAQSPFAAKSSYVGEPLPEAAVVRYRLSAVIAPCIASRRWWRRRVRWLRRGDQSGGSERDRIRPPERHRMRPVLHHLCEHASVAKCTISGCRLAPGSAPCLRARDAGLVPELHRPHPGRLAGGLLRIEPAPSAPGEAGTRP